MILYPAEKICATVIVVLFLLDAILIQIKGVGVDWTGYGVTCAIGIGAIVIGQLYNSVRAVHSLHNLLLDLQLSAFARWRSPD